MPRSLQSWKRLGAGLVLCGWAACCADAASAAPPAFNDPADVKALTALETHLGEVINIRSVADYYAPDVLTLDFMAGGEYHGREATIAAFEKQFAPVKSMKITFYELNVATDGTLGCAALQSIVDIGLKNGKSFQFSGRQIDGFRKINGKWQIEMEQISVPIDEKTGLGVMNAPSPGRGPVQWAADPLPGPATSPEQGKTEIRHWLDEGGKVTTIDQLMTYYVPGDDLSLYPLFMPSELRGAKAVRALYTPMMSSLESQSASFPLLRIDSDGLFGIQIDKQDISLKMKDGSTRKLTIRQSDCLRRVGEHWQSFTEMTSFPIVWATTKAVMTSSSNAAK